MLLNVSYNDPAIKRRIEEAVGAPFSLQQRWKMRGIGSQKLNITSSSIDIHNLLILDQNINTCNVELRPKGLIIRFRSLLETYALVIPYYKLKLYKGKAREYSIYMDKYFIKVLADAKTIHAFFRKVADQKSSNLPPSIEDIKN